MIKGIRKFVAGWVNTDKKKSQGKRLELVENALVELLSVLSTPDGWRQLNKALSVVEDEDEDEGESEQQEYSGGY